MRNEKCSKCLNNVAKIGIWTNLVMVILKFFIGITSGSKACIADGLHSASNIITAFAITLSQKVSSKKSNSNFQYGFGKIEFIAAGFVSILIIFGAVSLVMMSITNLLHEPTVSPHFSAIIMAILSICANEMLFRFMRCVGLQFKSQSIIANAWANRADCFSSFAVIVGVIGAKLGFHHLDPIAAMVVVAIIIKVSITILLDSVKALMDSNVNESYSSEIEDIVLENSDIMGISDLKTRQVGQKIWAEICILIDSKSTIKEGQFLAEKVKSSLIEKIMDLERVLVNFEPVRNV